MSRDDGENVWTVVASTSEVAAAGMLDVPVGRQVVLLIAQGEDILAFQGLCPHQLARLSEGMLVEETLQCPRHLARFHLSDGHCTGGWQLAPLRRYAVRVQDGNVLLSEPLVVLE